MSEPEIHVTWAPEAADLSPEAREAIVADLKKCAAEYHDQRCRAEKALEGLPFVAVPIDQLADIYERFLRLTRLGQHTIEEWSSLSDEIRDLKHAIFRQSDFGALYAGQWLPRDVRDAVRDKLRS